MSSTPLPDQCETGLCPPSAAPPSSTTSSSSATTPAQPSLSPQSELDPLLDPTTFIPPTPTSSLPRIVIEFCDRCRWLHRATWVQTELFLTFPSTATSGIRAIALVPRTSPETGGRFRVWIYREPKGAQAELVWDRKIEGGFPELKELVRPTRSARVENLIAPEQSLGHSDGHKKMDGVKVEVESVGKAGKEEGSSGSASAVPVEDKQEPAVDDDTHRFRC